MSDESVEKSFPYTFSILPEENLSEFKTIDGKIAPINMVEYKDEQETIVTPLPLYVPQSQLEAELEKEDEKKSRYLCIYIFR